MLTTAIWVPGYSKESLVLTLIEILQMCHHLEIRPCEGSSTIHLKKNRCSI